MLLLPLLCLSRRSWPYSPSVWASEHGREIPQHAISWWEQLPDLAEKISRNGVQGAPLQASWTASPDRGVGTAQLSWSDIPNPSSSDVIALFSPPVDWANATIQPVQTWLGSRPACEGWAGTGGNPACSGNGSIPAQSEGKFPWQLLNMRSNYEFRYLRLLDNGTKVEVLATSGELVVDLTQQQYLRLALTGNPREMRVTWTAKTGSLSAPIVRYGTSPDALTRTAAATPRIYSRKDFIACQNDSVAVSMYRDPDTQFTALMTGIDHGQVYYYQVGQEPHWSPVESFMGPKEIGADKPTRFFAFGDLGTALACSEHMVGWCEVGAPNTTAAMISAVDQNPVGHFDFVAHIGDISYATGRENRWEEFHASVEPIAARVPYMVTSGNHEYDHVSPSGGADPKFPHGQPYQPYYSNFGDDSLGDCNIPYTYRFPMPTTDSLDTENSYYSIEVGNVHFVVLSMEQSYEPDSAQFKWLQADLAKVNRSVTPFLVVGAHRAMYCSWDGPLDFIVGLYEQRFLEEVLVEAKVDLMLSGHYHIYQRTCPVVNQVCDEEKGVTHAVVGNAGMGHNGKFFPHVVPWSVFKDSVNYGYSVVETNRTTLTLTYRESGYNQIMDQFSITAKF